MEARKTPKSNLENKRLIFLEIGMILTLSVILVAFEWRKQDIDNIELGAREAVEVIEDIIIQTDHKIEKPLPKVQPVSTILKIVENDVDIEDEIIIDVEDGQNIEVENYTPIVPDDEVIVDDIIFKVVEFDPEFPGGEPARRKYLAENVNYPQMARETGIQGTVHVSFVIEKDGSISNVTLLRGIGGGCDEEALRVISAMPKWKPGIQRTATVRVQASMPIKFTLQ